MLHPRQATIFTVMIAASLAWAAKSPGDNNAAPARPAASSGSARVWRPLAEYPRPPAPDTGWGIHDDPNCTWQADPGFFRMLRGRYGITWFKVLACGANKLDVVKAAVKEGVEPVVRLYVDRPAPFYPRAGAEEAELRKQIRAYVEAGAHYIETGNEPNLSLEWVQDEWKKPERAERICRQWLRVRAMLSEEGAIPVFYAMSVGGEDGRSAGEWWQECFAIFKKWHKIDEAFAGTAFGAHLGTVNHPLDYPFDVKRNMPHANRAERLESLKQNNTCYLGVELLIALMDEYLPSRIPILSTEGGAFTDNEADSGYPKVTPEVHRDLNLGIFERMNPKHPAYWGDPLFAQMSWIWHTDKGMFAIDSWNDNPKYGRMPILDALEKAHRFDRGVIFNKKSR